MNDWRKKVDIVIIAPKIHDIGKNLIGYTCPDGIIASLDPRWKYQIQFNGQLHVSKIWIKCHHYMYVLGKGYKKPGKKFLEAEGLLSCLCTCKIIQ